MSSVYVPFSIRSGRGEYNFIFKRNLSHVNYKLVRRSRAQILRVKFFQFNFWTRDNVWPQERFAWAAYRFRNNPFAKFEIFHVKFILFNDIRLNCWKRFFISILYRYSVAFILSSHLKEKGIWVWNWKPLFCLIHMLVPTIDQKFEILEWISLFVSFFSFSLLKNSHIIDILVESRLWSEFFRLLLFVMFVELAYFSWIFICFSYNSQTWFKLWDIFWNPKFRRNNNYFLTWFFVKLLPNYSSFYT